MLLSYHARPSGDNAALNGEKGEIFPILPNGWQVLAGEIGHRRETIFRTWCHALRCRRDRPESRLKGGMPMRGASVKSNLRSVRYNAETRVLEVEFHAGGLCEYQDVPPAVYEALQAAASRDEYFERHIRFRFRHRHVFKI
jgi:hypothetical protein